MPRALKIVVADACVLYSNDQRNIFVTLGVERVFRLRGSLEIESEWTRNLSASKRGFDPERVARTASLVRRHIPDYVVTGYQSHVTKLTATDRKDRHVAAVAIACQPATVVTWNLRDFNEEELEAFGVLVTDPDSFLSEAFDADARKVTQSVQRAFGFASGKEGRTTWPEYLDRLATRGAPQSLPKLATRLRGYDLTLLEQDEPEDDEPEDDPSLSTPARTSY